MKWTALILALALCSCKPTDPGEEKPDKFEYQETSFRYADFNCIVIKEYKSPNSNDGWKYYSRTIFKITPTKTGAYLVDTINGITRFCNYENDPIAEQEISCSQTQTVTVYYSDGKVIEKTIVPVQ